MQLTAILHLWVFVCWTSLALNVAAQTYVRQSLSRRTPPRLARKLAATLLDEANEEGVALRSRGYRFLLAVTRPAVALAGLGAPSDLRGLVDRQLRFARRRRREHLGWYLLEPLGQPTVPLLGLLVLSIWDPQLLLLGESPARTACVGLAFKLVADVVLWSRVRPGVMPLRALALTPIKDCVLLGLWLCGLFFSRMCSRCHRHHTCD